MKDFSLNEKKVSNARRASGFYAIATPGIDMTAMQTWGLYGLRDEQEKYFQQMKSQLGFKIPDGCAPKYTSRKKDAPHRGRPAKPKTSELEH